MLQERNRRRQPLPFATARQDETARAARVPYKTGSGGEFRDDLMKVAKEAYEWSPLSTIEDLYKAYKDPSLENIGWAALGAMPGGRPAKKASKSLWKIIAKIADRGEAGNRSHITLVEKGFAPTEEIASLKGAMGEVRGEHRNRSGSRWEEFTNQIKTKGIQDRIFITVDHNGPAQIAEGNHRIDAAVELGMKQVPVEIRYFGKADKEGLLSERGLGGLPVKKIPADIPWHLKNPEGGLPKIIHKKAKKVEQAPYEPPPTVSPCVEELIKGMQDI